MGRLSYNFILIAVGVSEGGRMYASHCSFRIVWVYATTRTGGRQHWAHGASSPLILKPALHPTPHTPSSSPALSPSHTPHTLMMTAMRRWKDNSPSRRVIMSSNTANWSIQ